MDAANAAAATTRINNILISSSRANLTTQLAWPITRPADTLSLSSAKSLCNTSLFIQQTRAPKLNSRTNILFPTHCSAKPGVDNNNATDKNTPIEVDPNSTSQRPGTTPLNPPLSPSISKGLVLDLGPRNAWDSAEIGSPVVKRFIGDNEDRWFMWYHGRSNEAGSSADNIGLAVSGNGVHWLRGTGEVRSSGDVGLVMGCRDSWWAFDTSGVRPSDLVVMSTPMYSAVYWLFYTGEAEAESMISPETGRKMLPGVACSQDGRHWVRIEGDHHSGALLDVGPEDDWDSSFIASSKVVVHGEEDLRMYYHSLDVQNGCYAIGFARSRDGVRWVKQGKVLGGGGSGSFDDLGALNAHVVRNPRDGKYVMAYEGVAVDGSRSIGLAVSVDGLRDWVKVQEDAVLRASVEEEGWDSSGVGSPCLVPMDDEWRMYYRGVGAEGRTGIGMAVSGGRELGYFDRWEGLQMYSR
ncbi:hypothetical protein NMG60_11036235 [Bertholletia excelsa]